MAKPRYGALEASSGSPGVAELPMLRGVDPFGPTCDPRLYVPRLGTEAALQALREAFAMGRSVSVLSGPPGLGKTMVLQMFAAQLAPARCVYVPYVALGIEELAHVALDRLSPGTFLDESSPRAPAGDYTTALAAAARRDPTAPLVLLLDDAGALPLPTVRALRELTDALPGALRIIAAVVDDARAGRAIAALGGDVAHVRLRQPLTPAEAHAYVRGRLVRAGHALPPWAHDDAQIDALCGEAGGVPRELNTRATLRQREEEEAREREARGRDDEERSDPASEASAADASGETREPLARAHSVPHAIAPETSEAGGDAAAADAPPPAGDTAAPAEAPRPPRRRRRLRRTRGWY